MEDFVPFEIAKKLKEKGFPQHITDEAYIIDNYGEEEYDIGDRLPVPLVPDYMDDVAAPTISQVLKWLRDRNIHIEPFLINAETVQYKLNIMGWNGKFFCSIYNSLLEDANNKTITTYQSYEQVALAGIEHIIDNLI